jgi:hypothetical protein
MMMMMIVIMILPQNATLMTTGDRDGYARRRPLE